MPDEAKILAEPRKRILSLDGGGVRGVFTLEILARMEELLRAETIKKNPEKKNFVLADHFHFIAGTSTGAIIASLLSWGKSVADIRELYLDHCHEIFLPSPRGKFGGPPSCFASCRGPYSARKR